MLNKSEKILMSLNSKQSHFAKWQPHNSTSKRQRIGKQQENDESAFGSDELEIIISQIIQPYGSLLLNVMVTICSGDRYFSTFTKNYK